jgi:hypothetical protein
MSLGTQPELDGDTTPLTVNLSRQTPVAGGDKTPQTAPYCAASGQLPCAAGKKYIGRGPMQLSWK